MNKKINTLFSLVFLFSVLGCNNEVSSSISSSLTNEYTPATELEKAFYELKNNNFTIDYYDELVNFNKLQRNEKYYYTEYALQAEGDFGFSGIAQGDDFIFKYTLDEGEVVSGAPLINSSTGTRYETVFDYTYGMKGFDYSSLPTELGDDGYYTYEFGKSIVNDQIILPVFLKIGPTSIPPVELKIKVVKDTITFKAVILRYDLDGDGIDESFDEITAIVYDIGQTENSEIKQYLDDGKTSKDPLDLRFYKLFHPYLFTENYTVDLDATAMLSPDYNYFKMTEYCTETAILNETSYGNTGYLSNQGVLTTFNIENDKVNIKGTPTDSDGNFYSYLYSDIIAYPFSSLDYNSLLGYKDETNDNIYYLTDSYLIYVLSYLCYNEVYESNYCDKVKLEIINDETHEFKLYFDMYNKQTNRELGTYTARFYNLNNTKIPAVDEYLSLGDKPSNQTKTNLETVLNKFKNHNYSLDSLTAAGMAKYYYTENYMYCEIYGNTNSNFGFIKVNDSIYEFSVTDEVVTLDPSTDYAKYGYTLPSLGEAFGDYDDFGFISSIGDALYNSNNYEIDTSYGQEYWRLDNTKSNGLSNAIFDYYFAAPTEILPTGTGVVIKDDGNNSKLSFYISYVSSDGEYTGYTSLTYYDIGTTSHPVLEKYLNKL